MRCGLIIIYLFIYDLLIYLFYLFMIYLFIFIAEYGILKLHGHYY